MIQPSHRGSVIVIALWALGIAALVTSSIQVFAYRQALLGIEVHDRIQARWAARAGIESTIASMAEHTLLGTFGTMLTDGTGQVPWMSTANSTSTLTTTPCFY